MEASAKEITRLSKVLYINFLIAREKRHELPSDLSQALQFTFPDYCGVPTKAIQRGDV